MMASLNHQLVRVEIDQDEDSILGFGSYGKVYKAKYGQLSCAAKLLHDIFEGRNEEFERECQLLSAFKHPNIVQYLGTYVDPQTQRLALLMELMDGSLTKFLERSTDPLPYHIQLNICHDVALALSYLHSTAISHRDLSSNNVLLIGEGSRAKVTDFGVSKQMDMNRRLTLCPGSTVYMPPEALITPPQYSNKLDCFSHGVLTIQIITKNFPAPIDTCQQPETVRRKKDIDLIEPDHPLLPIALDCLRNKDVERPSADELCDRLSTLKEEVRYTHSVRDQASLVQRLQEEIQRIQGVLDRERNEFENERALHQNILAEKDELFRREIDTCRRELAAKDQIIEEMLAEKDKLFREMLSKRDDHGAARSPDLQDVPASLPPPPPPPLPPPATLREQLSRESMFFRNMQSRLRKWIKMMSRNETESVQGEDSIVDKKVRQWGEIHALSRRMSYSNFMSLARQKREEVEEVLRSLEDGMPASVEAIAEKMEVLQEGALWFPGGSKEMKETLPLYKGLEKRMEFMDGFVQVTAEMKQAVSYVSLSGGQDVPYTDLYNILLRIKGDFDLKHRHWGAILDSRAKSWSGCGLPVCHTLLARSRNLLCSLVSEYAGLCLKEASRLTGILLSIKCMRTTRLKEKLKDCLQLMNDSCSYFTPNPVTCQCAHCSSAEAPPPPTCHDSTSLLFLATQVTVVYVRIALEQFEGYAAHCGRQSVCEHFEGILKMLSLVKSLLKAVPGTNVGVARSTGILTQLPDGGEELGGVLYSTCVKLIQYIMSQQLCAAIAGASTSNRDRQSKEIVLWMMFSCKYVNQILEFLGSEQANQRGVADLLNQLQQMEDLLPDFQIE